jgi:hypothetical protein
MRKRWNALKKDIRTSILEKDCFGIMPDVIAALAATEPKKFAFKRAPEKVSEFMKWLKIQEENGILEVIRRPGVVIGAEGAWSDVFIRAAYQQGISRARVELKRAGYSIPGAERLTGLPDAVLSRGVHADRVGLIYSRTFEDLKTVTDVTNARIRRAISNGLQEELARGVAEGVNPREIAKNILRNVEGAIEHVGKVRAQMIARTEIIRAHTVATVAEYRQAAGEIDVEVQAEVLTAGFNVCEICEGLAAGGPYSLAKAEQLIPAHPNCYAPGTEVYTDRGFIAIESAVIGDRCLSLNPETFDLEYVPVVKTISRPESSELLHFTSRDFDMKVTKDHNMFVLRRERSYTAHREWEFITAAKVPRESRFYRSSEWTGSADPFVMIGDSRIESGLFAEFMGWWLSEGSLNNNSVVIAQSKTAHPENYDRITEVCMALGDARHRSGCIAVFNKPLRWYLSRFGYAKDKYVPEEIKRMAPQFIRRFLDAYAAGDGHVRKGKKWKGGNFANEITYATSSQRMADDIGECILKVGRRPSFNTQPTAGKSVKHHNGTYVGNTDMITIRECRAQMAQLGRVKRKAIKYNGLVHCVELEKFHTLWIRSDGKTAWSGNCRCALLPHVASIAGLNRDRELTRRAA